MEQKEKNEIKITNLRAEQVYLCGGFEFKTTERTFIGNFGYNLYSEEFGDLSAEDIEGFEENWFFEDIKESILDFIYENIEYYVCVKLNGEVLE